MDISGSMMIDKVDLAADLYGEPRSCVLRHARSILDQNALAQQRCDDLALYGAIRRIRVEAGLPTEQVDALIAELA
jgi:hypothetical protein